MPTLEDNMQFGDAEAVSTHLKKRVVELEDLANHLRKQRTLGERSVVLPNIVQCASRQLQILEASTNLPLEVAAGACRTAFELCVRTLVLEKRPDTIMDFWIERLYDEKSLVSAFQRLTHERTTAEDLEMLSSRIAQLDDYTITHKLKKPITSSMFKLAEAAGLGEEYKSMYGVYSKYTHASSWLVNSKDAERDGASYREMFLGMTQLYVESSVQCVNRLALLPRSDG